MSAASGIEVEVIDDSAPPTLPSARVPVPSSTQPVAQFGEGKKFDSGKLRAELLPAHALAWVEAVIHDSQIREGKPSKRFSKALSDARRPPQDYADKAKAWSDVAGSLLEWLEDEHGEIVPSSSTTEGSIYEMFPHALLDVAAVLTFGAGKYGPNNWQNVTPFQERYSAALVRHVLAHGTGEFTDAESGLPHLAHACTNALFLLSEAVGHDLPLTERL